MRSASVSIKKGENTNREDLTRHAFESSMQYSRGSRL